MKKGSTFGKQTTSTLVIVDRGNKATSTTVSKFNTDIISEDELKSLKSTNYSNGNPIINPEKSIGNSILYEILYRVKSSKSKYILAWISIRSWENEDEIFFSLPEFDNSKFKFDKFIESYHDEPEVTVGMYTCRKCGSKETISASKQTRSADEPETVRVECLFCSFTWTMK